MYAKRLSQVKLCIRTTSGLKSLAFGEEIYAYKYYMHIIFYALPLSQITFSERINCLSPRFLKPFEIDKVHVLFKIFKPPSHITAKDVNCYNMHEPNGNSHQCCRQVLLFKCIGILGVLSTKY